MATLGAHAARGAAYMAVAQLVLMLASYIVAVVLARALGPTSYGVYGIIYSFLLSVELIGRLGIPQALSRLLGARGERAPSLEATGVTLTSIVYLVVFAVFWLLAPELEALFHVANGTELFRLASLDIPFYGMFFLLAHVLNGRRDFLGESLAIIVYSVTKVVGVVMLHFIEATIEAALLLNVASSIVAVAFIAWHAGRATFRPTLSDGRELIKLAIPVAIGGIGLQLLVSVDLWILNAVGSAVEGEEKGYYVAALNIARMPNVIAFAITAVLIPSVARAVSLGDRDQVSRAVLGTTRFLALTLVPGVTLIAIEARPLAALLFSETYADADVYLRVLIFAHGMFFTTFMTFNSLLIAVSWQRAGAIIATGALVVAVVVNLVLVPMLGAMGAAFAALVSTGAAMVVAAMTAHRAVGKLIDGMTLVKSLIGTGLVCLIGWQLDFDGLALLVEMSILGLAFLGAMAMVGAITRADLAIILPAKTGGTHSKID